MRWVSECEVDLHSRFRVALSANDSLREVRMLTMLLENVSADRIDHCESVCVRVFY